MRTHPRRPRAAVLLAPGWLLISLLAAGCGQRTTSGSASLESRSSAGSLLAPIPPGEPGLLQPREQGRVHMPLEVGNRWDYSVRTRLEIVAPDFSDVVTSEHPLRSQILEQQTINEQVYFLQSEWDPTLRVEPPFPQFALRQDGTGLYNLDLFVLGPSATKPETDDAFAARFESSVSALAARSAHRAEITSAAKRLAARLTTIRVPGPGLGIVPSPGLPTPPMSPGSIEHGTFNNGGPLPGEITWLRYPLALGRGWIVREFPRFARFVSAREQTTVPAGQFPTWALRLTSELYGPQDRVTFWYAREGLIRVDFRATQAVTDWEGNVTGRVDYFLEQALTSYSLGDAPQ